MSKSTEMRNPEICWRNRSGCTWLGCGRNKRKMLQGLGEMDQVPWRLAEEDNGRHCPLSGAPLAFLPWCLWKGMRYVWPGNTWGLGSTMPIARCWITWVTHKSSAREPVFLSKPWGTCLIRSHYRRAQTKHWTPPLFQPLYRDDETHIDPPSQS